MSEGVGVGPEVISPAPPVEIPITDPLPEDLRPAIEPVDTTLPDTPVKDITEPPVPTDFEASLKPGLESTEDKKIKQTNKEEISTIAQDIIEFKSGAIYTDEYRKQTTEKGRQTILDDPEKNVLVTLHFLRNYPSDLPFPEEYSDGIPITVDKQPVKITTLVDEVEQEVSITQISKFIDKDTALVIVEGQEKPIKVSRSVLADALLLTEGDKLTKPEARLLTDSQKSVLTAHLDTLRGKEFPQGEELKELTKNVETATQELFEAQKDIDISTPLEEILVLSGFQKIQKELKKYIQNLTLEYESQTDPIQRKRILQTVNLAQEAYKENEISLAGISRKRNIEPWEKAISEIADGKNPELEKQIRDALLLPGGVADVIKLLSEQYGIKLDPTIIEKYGKTAGKMGLLAALGLMYALMKSGKEQPQGYQ